MKKLIILATVAIIKLSFQYYEKYKTTDLHYILK